MVKLDGLKDTFNKTSEIIKSNASKISENVKNIDIEKIKKVTNDALDSTKETMNSLQNRINDFDAKNVKETAINVAETGLKSIKKHFNDKLETDKSAKEILKSNIKINDMLSIDDALKIIYILMLADRNIDALEKETIKKIKTEIDIQNTIDEATIISYCDSMIEKSKEEEYLDYLLDEISNIIVNSKNKNDGVISKKNLIWNLLVIAYSDGVYSNEEKEIVRMVTRRLEINKDVIQEMELAIQTIMSINDEMKILDKKQYNKKELEERINIIMESVHELIGE